MLNRLTQKYTLILISTGNLERKQLISSLKIDEFFSEIIITPWKNISIFKKIINSSDQTLIIGDSNLEEIKFAKLLKTRFIQVSPETENPIKTIKKYELD